MILGANHISKASCSLDTLCKVFEMVTKRVKARGIEGGML